MKVKIKLEFKNGMIVETPNWKEVRSRGHLEEMIHWMIVENGVEMGKPNVFITTDPAEKRNSKNLAWTPTEIGKISVGNYVTQLLSKNPRKIVRIEKTGHLITLYEENKETPYFKAHEKYPMDLLIDHITKQPVGNLEDYNE